LVDDVCLINELTQNMNSCTSGHRPSAAILHSRRGACADVADDVFFTAWYPGARFRRSYTSTGHGQLKTVLDTKFVVIEH